MDFFKQKINYIHEEYASKFTEREQHTLFAHFRPHALHRVLGPPGPRRIIGVDVSLIPQCWHLH